MTEREKMEKGMLYDPADEELVKLRAKAHQLSKDYNDTYETEKEKRAAILTELLPNGNNCYLQGPIQFDYGYLTEFGDDCYANFNLVVLDCCPVKVGKNVMFGPNCSLMPPVHPMLAEERNGMVLADGSFYYREYAKPIVIGDGCWLASNVTVCGGVTIGEGTVIGAGSVVTRDIPSGVFAAGNPCRVIRRLTEKDKIFDL